MKGHFISSCTQFNLGMAAYKRESRIKLALKMVGIYSSKDEKRFLITPRPYGVENSCGVSISFRLRNDLGYSQLCRAGETQFFKFEYAFSAFDMCLTE